MFSSISVFKALNTICTCKAALNIQFPTTSVSATFLHTHVIRSDKVGVAYGSEDGLCSPINGILFSHLYSIWFQSPKPTQSWQKRHFYRL